MSKTDTFATSGNVSTEPPRTSQSLPLQPNDLDVDSVVPNDIVPNDIPVNKGLGTDGLSDHRMMEVEEADELEDGPPLKTTSTEDIANSEGLYSLINGLLYLSDKSILTNLRLCVPDSLIPQVLNLVHSP